MMNYLIFLMFLLLKIAGCFFCLCTFYNIIHGFVFFPPHLLPNLCNTRTNYSLTYNIPLHILHLAALILAHSFAFLELLPEEAVLHHHYHHLNIVLATQYFYHTGVRGSDYI